MSTMNCHRCHKDTGLEAAAAVFRTTECPHCMADMRCCLMCEFYDPSSYNNCREPQADRVADKDKSNFCGFFRFGNANSFGSNTTDHLSAADALFKK